MAGELPVVFLAFANAPDAHLGLLKAESREVFRALQPLEESGTVAVHREESSEFEEVYQDLLTHGDRQVIFHYGGHANGEMLQFEGGVGSSVGLARLLGQQTSLKLVFLNGCATDGHVALLLDAGVPAVIATSVPIGDQKAQEFAVAFYAALAQGRSVPQAFESSRGFVEGKYGAGGASGLTFTRAVNWTGKAPKAPILEWGLFTREGCAEDLEQWRLPDARAAWQVHLVDAGGPLRGLDGAPCVIEHRLQTRTVPAIRCPECGTASTAVNDDGPCPVCGSADVERGPVRTMIAERALPFAISADDARGQVRAHLRGGRAGDESPAPAIRLERLFLPYWVFDVDTHTTFEAERGWNRALGEVAPTLTWEPVRDALDLAVGSHLVPAGAAPAGRDAGARDWYWEMDRSEPVTRLDPATACVPLDRSMQSAFDEVALHLQREIGAEVAERVGGHDVRNLSTDTRYRRVAARTILLPHWSATADLAGGRVGLLVNGQTGGVRALSLRGTVSWHDERPVSMTERTYEPAAATGGAGTAISVFSGASVGLMVGVLLALSVSPVVGIFIGALGTGLAALLGLSDRHFSGAKGLRIGAFGLALLAGTGGGLYVRTHDLLSPSLREQRDEFIALGYSQADALRLLEGRIIGAVPAWTAAAVAADSMPAQASRTLAEPTGNQGPSRLASAAPAFARVGSNLFSSSAATSDCEELRIPKEREGQVTAQQLIENFGAYPGWGDLADAVPSQATDADRKALLMIALTAACGEDPLRPAGPLRPTAAQCQAGDFAGSAALRPVAVRIEEEISLPMRAPALSLVARFLCSLKP